MSPTISLILPVYNAEAYLPTALDSILAQTYQNSGLTHSRTLLPMVHDLLKNCGEELDRVEVIAVAAGPGSFTGLRIGVSTAKGLSWAGGQRCAPCSTLESMAWQCAHVGGEICAAMDARRNQVYCARFRAEGGALTRLTEDRAMGLDELAAEPWYKKLAAAVLRLFAPLM